MSHFMDFFFFLFSLLLRAVSSINFGVAGEKKKQRAVPKKSVQEEKREKKRVFLCFSFLMEPLLESTRKEIHRNSGFFS